MENFGKKKVKDKITG